MDIDIDVLPYIQRAINLANENGQMQGVTLDTAYIDGMNLGWEMTGTYDAEMLFKDISLKSYVGTEFDNTTGIQSILVSDLEDQNTFVLNDRVTVDVPKNVIEVDGMEKSMLILKSIKQATNQSISGQKGAALETFDNDLLINGNSYIYDYNNPVIMKFKVSDSDLTAAGNDIANLKFFAINKATQVSTEITAKSYDSVDKIATFELSKFQTFVVWNTVAATVSEPQASNPTNPDGSNNPGTGDQNNLPIGLAVLASITMLIMGFASKRKKKQAKK